MSLNALGASQLTVKSGASAVAANPYSYGSADFAGLCGPAAYDVILGTTGVMVGGTINIDIGGANFPGGANQAAACIVEAWLRVPAVPAAAGVTTIGAKYGGLVTYAAGPPASATLTLNAIDEAGLIAATFVGRLHFRVYVPRSGLGLF